MVDIELFRCPCLEGACERFGLRAAMLKKCLDPVDKTSGTAASSGLINSLETVVPSWTEQAAVPLPVAELSAVCNAVISFCGK